ncbi:hepatic lectin-like [Mya arenaria]|uniref:hepatic lectin-like n=1 Tax=Mya arenaria TaxID=6604 RepID=UPI0022E25AC1|nr:hepatic lectin-like [Mya arenaria]
MKDLLGIIILLARIVPFSGLTSCPDAWTAFMGSCYLFGHDLMTFHEAAVLCKSYEANLIHIETSNENTFIEDQLKHLYRASSATAWWIGLTDENVEGLWKWHDTDTLATFTDWFPGEPSNGGNNEDCASIYVREGFHWNDVNCQLFKYYPICEIQDQNYNVEVVG